MFARSTLGVLMSAMTVTAASGQRPSKPDPRSERLKTELAQEIDKMHDFSAQMVDMVFSFAELGFNEVETSKYLTGILERNGFTIERGYAGMPTAWIARWGSGRPVLALGSDIDGIPQASQKPGVAYHDPIVPGAPGHGEGHNSGMPLNVTAAIALKKIMERDKLAGTLVLWPGVAEEQLGTKAYFVRAGMYKDVDVAMFTHVGRNMQTGWGLQGFYNALLSAEFSYRGTAAHSAGAPWRGRSVLDAVELMNVGWNYRPEHLRTEQRSHYVIKDGGDQPNVVPTTARVWYFFRETDHAKVMEMFETAKQMAQGAALMTGTQLEPVRVLGSAWVPHFNKPIAEAMYANIKRVGLPTWSAEDQQLAKAVQKLLGRPERGLDTTASPLGGPIPEEARRGGGSDDIGDVSWAVPTVQHNFPANIPDLPGHHWSDAIAMATPIAHKGVTAGAKVQAMTALDLILTPSLVTSARDYFVEQSKHTTYIPFISASDQPAIWLHADIMGKYRDAMRPFYFDTTKYKTYLEQLGVRYPTTR
ncbi:MAG: amidohydrolase [Gemmatimonadaceae bacterium]